MAGYDEKINIMMGKMGVEHDEDEGEGHPFTPEIMVVRLPSKFKLPRMALYDGKTDPEDHLEVYEAHMVLYGIPDAIRCRAFNSMLAGPARR